MIEIYFDGACEPINPDGTGSYGWVIKSNGKTITKEGKIIGSGRGMTNNVAEYTGLISAIRALNLLCLDDDKLKILGDSNLVCNMVAKKWGFKKGKWLPHKEAPHLKKLLDEVLALLANYTYDVEWIPREKNEEADMLSKRPLIDAGIIRPESEMGKCPVCGGRLIERNGEFGKFFGCSNYPNCRFMGK